MWRGTAITTASSSPTTPTLYYYNLSLEGVLSGRKIIPVTLFTNTSYSTEADSDLDAYPDGFVGAIEGDCGGHSCSYAFRLGPNGEVTGGVKNLVDFDVTHQFWPRVAYDGSGFTFISVKDIKITGGGVMTKYIAGNWGAPSQHVKVVPTKEYQWDEFPEIAWNGDHFGALWTENSQRLHGSPWQTHFGSFKRTLTTSSPIGNRILDVRGDKSQLIWTKQIHAVGGGWTAHYSAWQGQKASSRAPSSSTSTTRATRTCASSRSPSPPTHSAPACNRMARTPAASASPAATTATASAR